FADAANAIAFGRFGARVEVRGSDEFAELGNAFNRMAAQLEQRLAELETERSRVRDATARFGEAMVATHDPAQLVRVVVESAVALENARLHRIVEHQALVDSLTGLANRRSFEETLRSELARAARFHDSVCVVFADLDDFKQVNDQHGHAAGDEVLKAFASALQ